MSIPRWWGDCSLDWTLSSIYKKWPSLTRVKKVVRERSPSVSSWSYTVCIEKRNLSDVYCFHEWELMLLNLQPYDMLTWIFQTIIFKCMWEKFTFARYSLGHAVLFWNALQTSQSVKETPTKNFSFANNWECFWLFIFLTFVHRKVKHLFITPHKMIIHRWWPCSLTVNLA